MDSGRDEVLLLLMLLLLLPSSSLQSPLMSLSSLAKHASSSQRTSWGRPRIRWLIILIIVAVILLYIRQVPSPSTSCSGILITSPSNSTYPFHYLSLPSLTPIPLVLPSNDVVFPTHVIPHPLVQGVFLVTNEVEDGEVWAIKVSEDNKDHHPRVVKIWGRVPSGGSDPAYCVADNKNEYLICSNVGDPFIYPSI